jgi:hypothetical protein
VSLTFYSSGVPPVAIENSIPESQHLRENVQPEMEERVEEEKPNIEIRKRQLQNTFD